MNKHSNFQSPQPNKTARQSYKLKVSSNHSLRCFYENKQSLFSSDSQTKASSIISGETHQNSFDISQTSFENQPNKADDFLREEHLLERKVIQNQLTLSEEYFSKQFIQHLKILLGRFAENPINDSFHKFLQFIIKPKINIFSDKSFQINLQQKGSTLQQAMQLLVGKGEKQYFIHTFSLIVCPLAFYIILIIYWLQPKLAIQCNGCFVKQQSCKQKNNSICQTKVKENIIKIAKAYIKCHSQQINQNQLLFLIIMYFLDELKKFKSQSSALIQLQKDLAKDIKTFRSIKNVKKVFGKQKYQIFQTKLNKFEKSNPFITAADATYHMIKSYIFGVFGSVSLQQIYQINEFNEYRKQYQLKKDAFCFWTLKNILMNQQKSLQIASLHIIKLMQMLKKFKLENNIEGISYLIPSLANLKTFLPKAWRHVVKRRPEIQKKFSQYVDLMLQHRFQLAYLQQNGIIWGQTNFIMAQKILKHVDEHKKYYTDFLSHFLYYRNKSKLRLMQPKFQLVIESQTQIGFSIGLVQNYLYYKYNKQTLSQQWNLLMERANIINQNISQSLISDILDYCFVGSTKKYQQADL